MNVGMLDRAGRVVIGLLLLTFANNLIFPATGWNWIGWIGVVPLFTAALGYCPAYSLLRINTR